jgi:hypothetical protein
MRWRSIVGFAHRVINAEEEVEELEGTICLLTQVVLAIVANKPLINSQVRRRVFSRS